MSGKLRIERLRGSWVAQRRARALPAWQGGRTAAAALLVAASCPVQAAYQELLVTAGAGHAGLVVGAALACASRGGEVRGRPQVCVWALSLAASSQPHARVPGERESGRCRRGAPVAPARNRVSEVGATGTTAHAGANAQEGAAVVGQTTAPWLLRGKNIQSTAFYLAD